MEVDYSSVCDEKLPIANNLAKEGKLADAMDILMGLEKQTRTVSLAINIFSKSYYHFFHALLLFVIPSLRVLILTLWAE